MNLFRELHDLELILNEKEEIKSTINKNFTSIINEEYQTFLSSLIEDEMEFEDYLEQASHKLKEITFNYCQKSKNIEQDVIALTKQIMALKSKIKDNCFFTLEEYLIILSIYQIDYSIIPLKEDIFLLVNNIILKIPKNRIIYLYKIENDELVATPFLSMISILKEFVWFYIDNLPLSFKEVILKFQENKDQKSIV